jgi:hypothetical protein
VAIRLDDQFTKGWFIFLGIIAGIFVTNETRFWCNPSKTLFDYKLAVYVHALGVHGIGNAASLYLLYGLQHTHSASVASF